jgi:hypothetical protein
VLPGGFLAADVVAVELVTIGGGLTLPADRVQLVRDGERIPLPAVKPGMLRDDALVIEFIPEACDIPGTYLGRLVARTASGERTVDVEAEVAPFVRYEVVSEQLGVDATGAPTQRAEIVVTANVRVWSLMVQFAGDDDGGGIALQPASPSAAWRLKDGTVIGRGPVDKEVVTIEALRAAPGVAWDGVLTVVGTRAN